MGQETKSLLSKLYNEKGFEAAFFAACGAGAITGLKARNIFGENDSVATNALEDIWSSTGLYTWLQVAAKLEIISDDANDTVAGSGAREVTVEGLDANFLEISETINTNGVSASVATTKSFLRVNACFVSKMGAYGSTTAFGNTGTITLRTESAGAIHGVIGISANGSAGFGKIRIGRYSVPANFSALMLRHTATIQSGQTAEVFGFSRKGADVVAAPFTSQQTFFNHTAFVGQQDGPLVVPLLFPEKTDIWFSAIGGAGNVAVSISAEVLLIENP